MKAGLHVIIGGGVSGLGAAQFLSKIMRVPVVVSEAKSLAPERRAAFKALAGVKVYEGGHQIADLDGAARVVLSPGLPPNHPLIVEAQRRKIPLISEIDLALEHYRGTVIGVTGTNGKSTTCAMLGHVLTKAGKRVGIGGNFGDPPTGMLADERAGEILILELSSYQLEQSQLIQPKAAIFTSFSFDHMQRHGTLEGYFEAKWRLFARMGPKDTAVIPRDVLAHAKRLGLDLYCKVIEPEGYGYGKELAKYGITEGHNQLNATFALHAAAAMYGCEPMLLAPFLEGFVGLPHRCQKLGSYRDVPVINDSKSTNVESTLVALRSQEQPVLLMMGGQGKGEPYAPLLEEKRKIAAIVTFGPSGNTIAKDIRAADKSVTLHEFPTLDAALKALPEIPLGPAHAILFSPGCASFDEFANYEHRGDVFKDRLIALGMT